MANLSLIKSKAKNILLLAESYEYQKAIYKHEKSR